MVLNRQRIIRTWGKDETRRLRRRDEASGWDRTSAAGLAADLLAHLEHIGLVECADGKWELAEHFDPAERYVLVNGDGKQFTHVRLAERELRLNRAKLSEARFALVGAQRLAKEAGVDSQTVDELFGALLRVFSQEAVLNEGPRRNKPRVITPDQPPDLENLLIPCTSCGKAKPQTREYYELYLSGDGNRPPVWYFRRDCKVCRAKKRGHKYQDAMPAVRDLILSFTREQGYPPTVRQVAHRTKVHSNAVRAAWRELALEDEDFPRVPRPLAEK